jgi:preprotein translocase subunit YajC
MIEMRKLVARGTLVVMLASIMVTMAVATRPAEARSSTGRIVVIAAVVGSVYYLFSRRNKKRNRTTQATQNNHLASSQ